jgi:hypothetical protein
VSLFIGRTSLLLVPVVILLNWRRIVNPEVLPDRGNVRRSVAENAPISPLE